MNCELTRAKSRTLQMNLFSSLHPAVFGKPEDQMGREEQEEEREVLDSIFPEEITGEIH